MAVLNLKAEGTAEARILEFLVANASESLEARINAGTKTLAGCMAYCKARARKMAAGEGCVCVRESEVFGWAIHFFEEDGIEEKCGSAGVREGGREETAEKGKKRTEDGRKAAGGGRKAAGGVDAQLTMMEELFK